MHAVAWRALCAAHPLHLRPAGRIIAGVRYPSTRDFHHSPLLARAPEEPAAPTAGEKKEDGDIPEEAKSQAGEDGEAAERAEDATETSDVTLLSGRRQDYGSAMRRAKRHRVMTGLPPLLLPEWFWARNVTCFGEAEDLTRWVDIGRHSEFATAYEQYRQKLLNPSNMSSEDETAMAYVTKKLFVKKIELGIRAADALQKEVASQLKVLQETKGKARELQHTQSMKDVVTQMPLWAPWNDNRLARAVSLRRHNVPIKRLMAISDSRDTPPSDHWNCYSLDEGVFNEIYASLRGELQLPPPNINIKDVNRQDTVLLCPVVGGLKYLDAVVQSVATVLEADVIRLDAEDIAQIVGGYLGDDVAWRQSPTAVLGYGQSDQSEFTSTQDFVNDDEDANEAEENDEASHVYFSPESSVKNSPIQTNIAFLQAPSKLFQDKSLSNIMNLSKFLGTSANSGAFAAQSANSGEMWNDHKTIHAMDTILNTADVKRSRGVFGLVENQQRPNDPMLLPSKGLIVQITGYNELNDNPVGYNLLKCLREAAKRNWYEGKNIMIVGTTAKNIKEKSTKLPNLVANRFSSELTFERPRIVYVPPWLKPGRILDDRKADVRDLNIRHVEHMIRKLLGPELELEWTINIDRDMWVDKKSEVYSGVWGYDWIRILAVNMLGIAGSDKLIDESTLEHTLHMLRLSEKIKTNWAKLENPTQTNTKSSVSTGEFDLESAIRRVADKEMERMNKFAKFKSRCTDYEKKLLSGVINPSDIHTTFADVQAPPETIEALKTLTSLSLIRPDSFSYGVLASDRIPGVLLYGPPGTGKTLLAKAVAKESGATMLEVSASEINDMYVGEGEKNVKALFSLAKKLAPCVVFIDEADSLFGSRGGSFQRKSHREIINQFLREWDGMANLSAFIMVATNRPFDLDEAVLRRLPRRLLIDLPVEKDREAILGIHLKDEILDESISLATLAKSTPFYSGSDLKNLSVAAALACVREENEIAARYVGEEPYVYPPKRILRQEHFDKAMGEISASISEDMSTLQAIRKFDERYGDRKGRPKKKTGMGFGGTTDLEPDSKAGRVRKLEVNV